MAEAAATAPTLNQPAGLSGLFPEPEDSKEVVMYGETPNYGKYRIPQGSLARNRSPFLDAGPGKKDRLTQRKYYFDYCI